MHTYLAGSTSCAADNFVCCPPTVTCWVVKCELWCAQGTGYNGVPMGNMSNQQLMQMQLHGMDLQRAGAGYPGDTDDCLPASVRVRGVTGSPVHGCECIPCPAVLVCQNSGIQYWFDSFCVCDRLKCAWWCSQQFRHASGAGHGCWCSSVLHCWRATGTPTPDCVSCRCSLLLHASCSVAINSLFFKNCCRASRHWSLKLLLHPPKLQGPVIKS